MTRRPRRNHSSAFKAKVALDAIRGDKTLAKLAKLHDVHPNQITDCKNQCSRAPSLPLRDGRALVERAATGRGVAALRRPACACRGRHGRTARSYIAAA